jgi:DNA repair protein SbcC/Rad50
VVNDDMDKTKEMLENLKKQEGNLRAKEQQFNVAKADFEVKRRDFERESISLKDELARKSKSLDEGREHYLTLKRELADDRLNLTDAVKDFAKQHLALKDAQHELSERKADIDRLHDKARADAEEAKNLKRRTEMLKESLEQNITEYHRKLDSVHKAEADMLRKVRDIEAEAESLNKERDKVSSYENSLKGLEEELREKVESYKVEELSVKTVKAKVDTLIKKQRLEEELKEYGKL